MGCTSSSTTRVHPVPQERSEQSQAVSASPPPEAIVTPTADKPEQLTVVEVESISPDKQNEKDTPKPLPIEDELVVEDVGNEPELSPTKEPLPTSQGLSDVVMKVESVHSLGECAPGALEDSPAPPELDVTMVNSPLPLAAGNEAALKSASATMVRDDDKLDLRATHSHADMDKKRGQEIDLSQVSNKDDKAQVDTSTSEHEEASQVNKTTSKSSLKKVDSEPTIDTVLADPATTNDAEATPPIATPQDTDATPSPEEESPVSEDNNPTEKPMADEEETQQPTANANEGEQIPTTDSNTDAPQPSEETDIDPPDDKEVLPDMDKPSPSKASPSLSKRTEDSDSRKIDHNTGQSSSVELQGNTEATPSETTPTPVVQEVSATV